MRPRLVIVLGGCMGLVLLAVARDTTAQVDSIAVQQQLLEMLARGDVTGALALFTDDAVIDAPSGACLPAPCVGKAAIQKDLARLVADKSRRVTPLNSYVADHLLVTRFDTRSDRIRQAGVERIIVWAIREMRGDKIAAIRCCLAERTDPQTARFLEWEQTHPPQP